MASSILARLAVLISGDSAGLNKSINQSEKQLSNFSKSVKGISGQLTAALGAVSFAALGKEMIEITSEFQKFEAVLTNTLGSKSEAQEALKRIQDFAAKTPFSVQELTASFVKLANQGFEPTTNELRKLGDLASSTGKSFDQLTEAIIDAQTGEFERLKEFGIRAKKQGDQVTFTFKGVETQTKFTSDSIRDYILSLGELEGVSGSMVAISGTLGGSISNLGDSFDKFLLSLGSITSGPLKAFIDQAQLALETLSRDISGDVGATSALSKIKEEFVDGAETAEQMTANIQKLKGFLALTTAESAELAQKTGATTEEMQQLEKDFALAKEFSAAYGTAIGLLTQKLEGLKKETEDNAAPTLGLIQKINADIKHFEELKQKSFSIEEIGQFNNKLQELKDKLDLINQAGSESGFLKNLNAGIQPTGDPSQTGTPETPNPFGTLVPDTDTIATKLLELQSVKEQIATRNEALRLKDKEAYDEIMGQLDKEKQARLEAAQVAADYGTAVGSALGDAAAGQITFAQAAKRATADIVKTLLARAMAGIIASAATAGGPPPVAIALAAAGVAAIGALFAKFVGGSGGASGGGGISSSASRATSVSRVNPIGGAPEDRIQFNVDFRAQGTELVAVVNNTNKRAERTG